MSLQMGWCEDIFHNIHIQKSCFNDLKIIHLSDLHINKMMPLKFLKNLVEKINNHNADIVLLGGDILQTKAYKVKEHLALFALLKAPCYFVSGNHDLWYGTKELESILTTHGVKSLENKKELIVLKNQTLQLVGLSDRYSRFYGIKRPVNELLGSLDASLPTILLIHQPKDIKLLKDERVDLVLAGHTHGGQIYPFHILTRLVQPYMSGLYQVQNRTLFVNRGVGYWGVPIRYKAKSEVAVITL